MEALLRLIPPNIRASLDRWLVVWLVVALGALLVLDGAQGVRTGRLGVMYGPGWITGPAARVGGALEVVSGVLIAAGALAVKLWSA